VKNKRVLCPELFEILNNQIMKKSLLYFIMFLVVLLIGRHQLKLQNQIKIKVPVSKTPNIKNQDSELKMNEISTVKFWINQDNKNSRSDLAFSAQRPIARENRAFNFL
jgi:hypothetical protein